MIKKPKCPECGSGQVYYRRIPRGFVCRRCGHLWKVEGAALTEEKVARGEREEA